MEISEQDIVKIQTYDFENYNGEYIVLPMNFYESYLRISNRILPVFLALSLNGDQEWSEKEVNLLRRFSPIGCRDERTMRELLEKGIDAYFNGCLVSTFPSRIKNIETQKTVFFVDAHESIKNFVPKEISTGAKYFTHEYYMTPKELMGNKDIFEFAEQVIDMYRNEAKLIITSRFHGAVIALALGIPVILVIDNFYFKYTWINKYIPVYEPKDVMNIDWNPPEVVISDDEKKLMINIACKRIKETYDKYYSLCSISEIRESINIKAFEDLFYGQQAIKYITEHWKKDVHIEYVFWGVTNTAIKIQTYIKQNYPKAKLCKIYDMVVRNKCLGFIPEDPVIIEKGEERFIFVTADSAITAARELFAKMGKTPEQYFLCERQIDYAK